MPEVTSSIKGTAKKARRSVAVMANRTTGQQKVGQRPEQERGQVVAWIKAINDDKFGSDNRHQEQVDKRKADRHPQWRRNADQDHPQAQCRQPRKDPVFNLQGGGVAARMAPDQPIGPGHHQGRRQRQEHQRGIQVQAKEQPQQIGLHPKRGQIDQAQQGIGQQDDGGQRTQPLAIETGKGGGHGRILACRLENAAVHPRQATNSAGRSLSTCPGSRIISPTDGA